MLLCLSLSSPWPRYGPPDFESTTTTCFIFTRTLLSSSPTTHAVFFFPPATRGFSGDTPPGVFIVSGDHTSLLLWRHTPSSALTRIVVRPSDLQHATTYRPP
ncbi:hypothetical protein GUJ93_ZPchr0066g46491 [Zizania palustris]|uniref:Uncharacterized protein n=1 Tax=Zizania palustris TaxID=103762 RepID=A0A8J5VEN4_ZIZPA|nr:hypothetical protein GUJ93_ZPchr0066g46491 [Zizania palustris]